jgi:hypothetical protein
MRRSLKTLCRHSQIAVDVQSNTKIGNAWPIVFTSSPASMLCKAIETLHARVFLRPLIFSSASGYAANMLRLLRR